MSSNTAPLVYEASTICGTSRSPCHIFQSPSIQHLLGNSRCGMLDMRNLLDNAGKWVVHITRLPEPNENPGCRPVDFTHQKYLVYFSLRACSSVSPWLIHVASIYKGTPPALLAKMEEKVVKLGLNSNNLPIRGDVRGRDASSTRSS
jgi:hypothetical protein